MQEVGVSKKKETPLWILEMFEKDKEIISENQPDII
jgi:hypothetical protein